MAVSPIWRQFHPQCTSNATLAITYIGYQPQNIQVNGRQSFNVKLQEEAMALEQVVVTAMGIKKKEASLTYSTTSGR